MGIKKRTFRIWRKQSVIEKKMFKVSLTVFYKHFRSMKSLMAREKTLSLGPSSTANVSSSSSSSSSNSPASKLLSGRRSGSWRPSDGTASGAGVELSRYLAHLFGKAPSCKKSLKSKFFDFGQLWHFESLFHSVTLFLPKMTKTTVAYGVERSELWIVPPMLLSKHLNPQGPPDPDDHEPEGAEPAATQPVSQKQTCLATISH